MNLASIHHEPHGAYAYPVTKDRLALQLRAAKDDLSAVTVMYGDRYGLKEERVPMKKYASDMLYDYWRITIRVASSKMRYHFALEQGDEMIWYNEYGFSKALRRIGSMPLGHFIFPIISEADRFKIPAWVDEAIVYQIYPDCFARAGEQTEGRELLPWDAAPTGDSGFYGGDFYGVIEKIPYLTELGINTIYFNPIFAAGSSHRYDVKDYKQADPLLGGNEAFIEMRKQLQAAGIRVILDLTCNSSGDLFAPFQDVKEKGRESKYWDWFFIKQHPFDSIAPGTSYESFGHEPNLPKLRLSNPEVRAFLMEVARFWAVEMDVDGFRLDVANEVEHQFWREMRQLVRAHKEDFLLIGEAWDRGISFLQGDQLDGITNYHFANAVYFFLGEERFSLQEFDGLLTMNRVTLPEMALKASWNIIESHDTNRFQNAVFGDVARLKLAATLQLTVPGTPCLFYGTEVGMGKEKGALFKRYAFDWNTENWDRELLEHYRCLIHLRREYKCLQNGTVKRLLLDPVHEVYAYALEGRFNRIVVFFNFSHSQYRKSHTTEELGFKEDKKVRNLLQNQVLKSSLGEVLFDVAPQSAMVLVEEKVSDKKPAEAKPASKPAMPKREKQLQA